MSSNAPHDHDDPHASHPDDDHDDAVIGKALRLSLIALVALGVIGGAIAFFFTRPTEAPPEQVIEVAAPEAVAQAAADPPSVTFADVTASIGIDFIHESGAKGDKLLPESMGSGAAFADLDNDGDNDLVLINGSRWPHDGGAESPAVVVYRNDAGGDGAIALTDVTAAIGLADVRLYGTGLAIADVDGDGWRDLFIAAVGGNRLLRNVDGQRFVDITRQAGVAGADDAWSTSAGFADLDRDGDLDLYVCNYVRWSKDIDFAVDFRLTGVGRAYGPPVNYEGTFSQLYRNDGDGTFTDVSEEAGIRVTNDATGGPVGKGLGLIFVDIDRDGWLDIFVANDTVQNFVFRNRGGEADGALAFEEVGQLYGLAYGRAGEATGAMGIDVAHYRNDGELGMAIGNFANEMTSLYISQGDPTLFADEAIVEGVGAPSRTLLSFGVLFFDYDLDGRLDILQVNGHLETQIAEVDPSQSYEQPSQLFWNAGPDARATFIPIDVAEAGALAEPLVGRGSAYGDLDGDGDLDLVLTQVGRRAIVLRNDQQLGHGALRVQLADPTTPANRDALGAWLELETTDGVVQRRPVLVTRSYQSQSELPVTFGLGPVDDPAARPIAALRVVWPDGATQSVEPAAWQTLGAGETLVVTRAADGA